MPAVIALLTLAGYVAMLLWGTRMVTMAVQRGYGDILRQRLGRMLRQTRSAVGAGLAVTLALQSSTATCLMGASFVSDGMISLESGFLMMLGANLGTAMVARALAFPISAVAPILILIGFITVRRARRDRTRALANITVGLGLMLLALGLMVGDLHGWMPVNGLGTIGVQLASQPLLIGIFALLLTWACHSSVAVILIATAILRTQSWPVETVLAVMMGANLGGALSTVIEVSGVEARRLPLANLVVRSMGVTATILLLPFASLLPDAFTSRAYFLPDAHLVFNLLLVMLCWPLAPVMARTMQRWLPSPTQPLDPGRPRWLDEANLGMPSLVLASAERESLRLAEQTETLLNESLMALRAADEDLIGGLSRSARSITHLALDIRRYLARLPDDLNVTFTSRRIQIGRFLYDMEQVVDLLANGLLRTARNSRHDRVAFSDVEWSLLSAMHTKVVEGLRLAVAVLMDKDPDAARLLISNKAGLRDRETDALAARAEALRDEDPFSSRAHEQLVTAARDLKRIHSHLTAVAYRVLEDAGQLRSRLIDEDSPQPCAPNDAACHLHPPPPGQAP